MDISEKRRATVFKVGLFTFLGLVLIGVMTIYVNDKPYWWKPCKLVHINITDATGLRPKSPVRSMGIDIGYLRSIALSETHVKLGICITAPVEVLPSTRAYIRGEGFLGDKFVELKPVKYTGEELSVDASELIDGFLEQAGGLFFSVAHAANREVAQSREIPVGDQSQNMQELVGQVDDLVEQMTALTTNLKDAIDPKELRRTMIQLNQTLQAASKTLSPQGGLNTTAQRSLEKLEGAIEQLLDMMTRVNRGEGSVGKIINDPEYAEELMKAVKNVNTLLGGAGDLQLWVNLGAASIPAYNGARAWFELSLWPEKDRYYKLGIAVDPRGALKITETRVTSGGLTTTTRTEQIEQNGLLLTGMLGKVFFGRVDLSAGALYGDGAASGAILLGPMYHKDILTFRGDVYARSQGSGLDMRSNVFIKPIRSGPFSNLYLYAGLESVHKINGETPYLLGAGLRFSDDDIKLLFALR